MPILEVDDVDAAVWKWVKEDIGNPVILERKLREIQAGQKQANSGAVHPFTALEEPETHLHPQAQRALCRQIK